MVHMTLIQLQIFSLVSELGGFTAAASRLGVSQSAISHAIKSLEQELGVTLFLRRHSTVEPTNIGQQLLLRARVMLGAAETMRQEASASKTLQQGYLSVGSFGPTSSVHLLPAILNVFCKAYPGIEVHIDEAPDKQVLQWLEERRVDLGFVVLPNETFKTYPIFTDQMVAVLPQNHRLAQNTTVSLSELSHHPFALTEAGSGALITRLFARARVTPQIRYRTTQILSTLDTVARGDAVTILAETALPKGEQQDYVIRPLAPSITRQVGLAIPDEDQASPATQAFIKTAVTWARRTRKDL